MYIGSSPLYGTYEKLDSISSGFNGTTTEFNCSSDGVNYIIGSSNNLIVVKNGLLLEPDIDYWIGSSGHSIVFDTAPILTDNINIRALGHVFNLPSIANGVVTTSKIANNAVTSSKIDSSVTALFATASQGSKADTAVQPAALSPYMLTSNYNPGTVLLATYTPAAASSVNITSVISSTYNIYKIEIINLVPSTDNEIWLRVSTDNGSTWKSGASDYSWVQFWMNSVSGTPGSTADRDAADSQINLSGIVESSSGIGLCASLTAFNPLGTSSRKSFMYQSLSTRSTPELLSITGGGEYLATTAVNALQILPASGTFSGIVKIYGLI